jgi:hypothetical protein
MEFLAQETVANVIAVIIIAHDNIIFFGNI